ncbi:hypothetical protein BKA83DRAFT_19262 [Pisolithus microcarpus]|nr:hypothetical protein BKA83DRAFT_19262 [Pisolithus microcarpus]
MTDRGGQEQGQTLNAGDPILSIAVSQDGRWVVSGDSGRNAATPEKPQVIGLVIMSPNVPEARRLGVSSSPLMALRRSHMNQIAAAATTTAWQAAEYFRHATRLSACTTNSRPTRYWTLNAGTGPSQVGVVATSAKLVLLRQKPNPRRSSAPSLTVTNMLFAVTTIRRCMPAFLVEAPSNAQAVAMQMKFGIQEHEGYAKYKGTPFKVSTLNHWISLYRSSAPRGHQRIHGRRALFNREAANDSAEVDSLIGPEITSNRYHIPVARTHLTLNLGLYHPDIEDEVHTAFEELFNLMDNGTIDELLSFTIDTDAADSAEERPTSVNVRDINDIILQWLIDERQMSSTKQSTLRVLTINFASIQALYNLAAYPQHVGPLREEVDAIIQEHGWTKEAIALMRKAASFLVETRHLEGILIPSAQKKSNGGSNPVRWNLHTEGTHLSVPTCVFHCDSAVYDNPSVFNPFRFS